MKLADVVDRFGFEVRSATGNLDKEVTGGYASDLISDVLALGAEGNLWVTLQTHQNIVATASLKELVGIVLVITINVINISASFSLATSKQVLYAPPGPLLT